MIQLFLYMDFVVLIKMIVDLSQKLREIIKVYK